MYNPKEDPLFAHPFTDRDEQRVRENVSFRYIHGGFEGTSVKFSFCFPDKDHYAERFYQFLSPFPGPDEEMASLAPDRTGRQDQVLFALLHGATFVESNMGSTSMFGPNPDPTMLYRSSAAVAEYSRQVAQEIYGSGRPYGYVYGGSGGGYKTCACIENTTAFDGAVPFVTACPVALPNILTVTTHARRVLRNKFDWIAEAVEPGSTQNIASGLNEEENAAFEEVTRMGLPIECWVNMKYANDGSLVVLTPGVRAMDPDYFTDFWTKPGYLGTESGSSALRDRVQLQSVIKEVFLPGSEDVQQDQAKLAQALMDSRNSVDDAWKKMLMDNRAAGKPYLRLAQMPEGGFPYLGGINIIFLSGKALGSVLPLAAVEDGKLMIGKGFGLGMIEDILSRAAPGDLVLLDNSDYIAMQTYHRHQVPEPEYTVWDQFRDPDGSPKYPQRASQIGTIFAYQGAGAIQSGNIQGKVIMLNSLADGGACTWMADWYRNKVQAIHGSHADDCFRLWCMEHCGHSDQEATLDETHVTSYLGALYQALLDIAAWTEKGIEPPQTTGYSIRDGQPVVPENAQDRKGVQPVVHLFANGGRRTEVRAGETVHLNAVAELPDGAGTGTSMEWSFDGEPFSEGKAEAETTYEKPGNHFATVRVKSNRDPGDPFTVIQNIDRVRIIVQ